MENGYRTKVGVITYHSAYNFGYARSNQAFGV